MLYGEQVINHWRCDECGRAIARSYYAERNCFCSQACRQASLTGGQLGVCHDATGLWAAAGIVMPAGTKTLP
jgi:hypothetical protein